MNSLGIYFGPRLISIVEAKGKGVVNNIRIPQSAISPPEWEEKVPSEIKITTLLKDELKKNKIEAKQANIALSGHDLIIRNFEIPLLPAGELNNAVNFEVRKYIPFKVEDLISGFQLKKLDKYKRKNLVLFVGTKKETLDKYFTILNQLDFKIESIEYAAFGILRLLRLGNVKEKGIIGVVNIDLIEEDEADFMILEDGFPIFSRGITFISALPQAGKPEEPRSSMALEKLKKEIRISLDYYYRKFPTKKIKTMFFITGEDYRSDLEMFIKEMGLDIQFIDVDRYIGKPVSFSLGFIKGYSSALSKIVKTNLEINLLLAKTRLEKEKVVQPQAISLLASLKVEPRIVILGLLICIATFFFGLYRIGPLKKELSSIIDMRPKVLTIGPTASYEKISNVFVEHNKKISAIDNLLKNQVYLTELLDTIGRITPEGMWLVDFSFKKEENKTELILRGFTYLADSARELELVNNFLSSLKEKPTFAKYFKEANITTVGQSQDPKQAITVTNFEILCRSPF